MRDVKNCDKYEHTDDVESHHNNTKLAIMNNDKLREDDTKEPENHQSKETWKDLRKFIKPLMAVNSISFVCGLNDGSMGVVLPQFKHAFGFVSAAAFNGVLVNSKLEQRGALYLGMVASLLAYVLIGIKLPFPATACLMVIQGAGVALMEAAMNVYTANVPHATMMLNVTH
ncbi:hypothetical protein DFQ30_009103, partial [Apophysomyces sp. BC1015]